MMLDKSFMETAKALARNPLGIIALFIILVYAVASIVIDLAKAEFYANPQHPAVLFLTIFPFVVLVVFAYLVARHNEKLYAPSDYRDQKDFLRTLRPPGKLPTHKAAGITSDKKQLPITKDVKSRLDESYSQLIGFGYIVMHKAEIILKRNDQRTGQYRVRVWIESLGTKQTSLIESVAYRVWDNFDKTILTTSNVLSDFDLWLNVYGEFPILALVRTKDGKVMELQRYIDLPGRPPE